MKNQLISFLYEFISERGCTVNSDHMLSLSFKNDVVLDSFETLTLVMQIELTFGIKIELHELLDPKTDNIGEFIKMVIAKQ